jgi:hypothetical protein
MPLKRFHHRDMRLHRVVATALAKQHQALDRGPIVAICARLSEVPAKYPISSRAGKALRRLKLQL